MYVGGYNQTKTAGNQEREWLMLEVIQCLIDWLKQEPSDEKAHRILSALAVEALKFAKRGNFDRRFTVEEIIEAVHDCPAGLVDTKKWLDWKGAVLKYWNSRELQVVDFARKRGLQHYPKPERYSPKGGRGNHVLFISKLYRCQKSVMKTLITISNLQIELSMIK